MYQIDFEKKLHIHFIGIGGISMSGLAEILLEEGFFVSGSDAQDSALTRQLAQKGAVIQIGQRAAEPDRREAVPRPKDPSGEQAQAVAKIQITGRNGDLDHHRRRAAERREHRAQNQLPDRLVFHHRYLPFF